jgi:iron complex outermembrane receptor protein
MFFSIASVQGGTARAQFEEEEYFQAGEWVVTASKHLQRIEEAPAAMSVITEEEIRQSGALTIPELLRMVPGMDVMTIESGNEEVCARGLNRPFSNKMLVMIDGRSMYMDFLGVIWWEALNLVLDDIKRIEVIRGPGSALYGANAFSGIVNIITKSPEEAKGTGASFTGGTRKTFYAVAENGGVAGRFGHKVTAQFSNADRYLKDGQNSLRIFKGRALAEYRLAGEARLSLEAGGVRNDRILFHQVGGFFRIEPETIYHVDLYFKNPDSYARIFWNRGKSTVNLTEFIFKQDTIDFLHEYLGMNIPDLPMEYGYTIGFNTIDLEAQHRLAWREILTLTAGASFRINQADSEVLFGGSEIQEVGAGYLQAEYKPAKPVSLLAGARYDYHSLTGHHLSPRASVNYSPRENHNLRFSYTTAYRNPNFLESYSNLQMSSVGYTVTSEGNRELKPERVQSFELGYRTRPSKKISGSVDLFYNLNEDFIDLPIIIDRENIDLNKIIQAIGNPVKYINAGRVRAVGGELGLKAYIFSWLSGLANYSYQNLTSLEDNPDTVADENGKRIKSAPEHKIGAGFGWKIPQGLSGSVLANFQSETEWPTITGLDLPKKADAYVILNARLAYGFWKERAEVSVAGYNLLKPHYEYPRGAEIDRRVTGTAQVKF